MDAAALSDMKPHVVQGSCRKGSASEAEQAGKLGRGGGWIIALQERGDESQR
jgi:hypothetical protein